MGRPKLPEFTAQDADDYGHLKAQAADILREIEALKKKAIKSKIDCKEGSMFSVMTNLSCPRCESQVEVLKKRDAYD